MLSIHICVKRDKVKRDETLPLSYKERQKFKALTGTLHDEITEDMRPTDGWDPLARENPLKMHSVMRNTEGLVHFPHGHIALQGDFSDMTPGTPKTDV
jgi:hypothetical protein